MANKITYNIGFNVDKTALQDLRNELRSFQSMSVGDLRLFNKEATIDDLREIKRNAEVLEGALEKSFNPQLGTVNIEKFNSTLKNSGQSIKSLEASFAKAGAAGKTAFRNATAELFTTQKAVKQTSSLIDSMATTLFNTVKWSVASGAINAVTGAIRNAWNYTVKLDSSLNDIRIVTEKSAEDMERFADKANKAAKALGAQTTAYTKASLIYYQQGLGEEDVEARTNVTIKAANVTGQSAAEVSEQLTAVWNGYKVVAEEAELYVDKLSAVAATTAADLEELSDGMSKVASGANAMGVDIDQLTAQLATIVSVTRQDASVVGTALKTIFARMGDLKVDGVDEFGVSLGDVSGTLKKVGIDVLDAQGNLRDMGTVIEEVAGKWGGWTEAQQQAVAVAIAGKRQYNNLLALFENWDMYESALSTSQTSEGTLQKQQDIYMDSLSAKLQQVGTSAEKVYKSLFDSESMKDMLDILSLVLDKVGNFINTIGGGGNLLLGVTSILGQRLNNEIAKGLWQVAYNSSVVKENVLQSKAEMILMADYSNVTEEAMEKMVALQKEKLKAEKVLTEEEKAQYDFLIKQTAELHNQLDAEKDREKNIEDYYEAETGTKLSLEAQRSSENRVTAKVAAEDLESRAAKAEDNLSTYFGEDGLKSKEKKKDIITQKSILYNVEEEYAQFKGADDSQLKERAAMISQELEVGGLDEDRLADLENEKNAIESIINAREALNKTLKDGLDTQNISKKQQKEINSIQQKYIKGQISQEEYEKRIKNAVKNSSKEFRNMASEIKKGTKASSDLKEKIVDLEKEQAAMSKMAQFKTVTKGVVDVASGFGKVLSGVLAVKNAFSSWDDNSLSFWEKLSRTFTGLLTAFPMIASGLKNVWQGFVLATSSSKGLLGAMGPLLTTMFATNEQSKKSAILSLAKVLGIELEEKSIKDLTATETKALLMEKLSTKAKGSGTAATIAQTVANWALQLSMWQIMLIILAIVAAVLILVAIMKGISALFKGIGDNGQKAFEKAGKAAESAAEQYQKVKEAYEDLKKSLADYNDAQTAIEALTKGTDEWKQAIQDANQQVLDLIDAYPELAQYVSDVDGQLKISEEGQEKVLENQEKMVNQANRMRMATNINKATAENSMIEQTGANNALKTDAYRKWGAGIGIAGLVLSAGGTIPGLNQLLAVGAGLDGEALRRENAYSAALDVIAEKGNSVAASEEAFADAMAEAGIGEDLIDALWENRDALVQNSLEISANNAAIKLQQQQIANSFLQDKSIAFQNSKHQSEIAKIIGQNANQDSDFYQKAYKDLVGNNKKISKKEATSIANKYFAQNGITATGISYDKESGVIKYLDENNEEREISADAMAVSLAQEKALQLAGAESTVKNIERNLNKISEVFGNSLGKATSLSITKFVAGESASLEALSQQAVNDLDALVMKGEDYQKLNAEEKKNLAKSFGYESEAQLNEAAKALGYENAEKYLEAIQTSINNYNYEKLRVTVGLNKAVKSAFAEIKSETWTLAIENAVAKGLQNAFETGGSRATNALKQFFADASKQLSEEDMQALAEITETIDWSSSSAIIEFNNQVKDLGINLDNIDVTDFTAEMSKVVNVVQDVLNGLGSIQTKLKELNDLTKDLNLGSVITQEDYNNLIKYNKELENFFILTADGYKYLGGADDAITAAKNGVLAISKINAQFAIAEEQGTALLNNALFDRDATTETTKRSNIKNIAYSQNYRALLEASGYTQEQIQDALGKGAEMSSIDLGGGKTLTGYSLQSLQSMTSDSLATILKNEFGVTDTETETVDALASRIIEDASKQVKKADELIQDAYSDVANTLTSIERGVFEEKREEALALSVSVQAKNYSELKSFKGLFAEDSQAYQKLALVYLAEEADQLGINAEAWKHVSELTLEQQEAILNNKRALEEYDAVDFYKKYDTAINKTTKSIDNLADAQERTFGAEFSKNLLKQIDLQKELLEIEKDKYNALQEEAALRKESFEEINASALSQYGIAIQYESDGTISQSTRDNLLSLLGKENLSEEEREYIKGLVSDVDTINEKILEGADAYKEAFINSINAVSDAISEIFDQELTLKLDLSQLQQEIDKIKIELDKITANGSLSFFGEETAKEKYDSAIKEREYLAQQWNAVQKHAEEATAAYYGLKDKIKESGPASEKTVEGYTSKNIGDAIKAAEDETAKAKEAVDNYLNSSEYSQLKNAVDTAKRWRLDAQTEKGLADERLARAKENKNAVDGLSSAKTAVSNQLNADLTWLFSETAGYTRGSAKGTNQSARAFGAVLAQKYGLNQSEYSTAEITLSKLIQDFTSNDEQTRKRAKDALAATLTDFTTRGTKEASGYSGDATGDTMTDADRERVATILNNLYSGTYDGVDQIFAMLTGVDINKVDTELAAAEQAAKDAGEKEKWAEEVEKQANEALEKNEPYQILYEAYQKAVEDENKLKEIQKKLDDEQFSQVEEFRKNLGAGLERYLTYDAENESVAANTQKFYEDLKGDWEKLSGYYQDLMEQLNAIYESWGQAQEEIMATYDKEIEKRSTLNSLLTSSAELYELIGKKTEGYGESVQEIYAGTAQNSKSNYLIAQQQVETLENELKITKESFEAGIANKEMYDQVQANYNTALENMLSAAQEWANSISEFIRGSLGAAIDEFVAKTNDLNLSLKEIQEDWSRAQAMDERDLDEVNAAYGINSLLKNIDKSIDETDNYSAQKKLAELRAKQEERLNRILAERGKLSQYELDRANAEYELTLKRIALEEAQMTASKMKLVRDASGNYSYQYVADQDKVSEAEDAVAKAENDLYNLDKERQASLIEDYYSTLAEMQDAVANAGDNRDEVVAYYSGLLSDIQSELGVSSNNLNEVGQMLLSDSWTAPFEKFATAISESNLEDLFGETGSITTILNAAGEFSQGLDSVLGDNSAVISNLETLSQTVSEDQLSVINATASSSAEIAKSVLENLPGLLTQQKTLEATVSTFKDLFKDLEKDTESELGYLSQIAESTKKTADKDWTVNFGQNPQGDTGGGLPEEGGNTQQ